MTAIVKITRRVQGCRTLAVLWDSRVVQVKCKSQMELSEHVGFSTENAFALPMHLGVQIHSKPRAVGCLLLRFRSSLSSSSIRSIAPIILSHFPVEEPRPDAPMVEAAQARTTSSCPVGRLSSCLSMRALSQNPHQ